MVLEEAEEVGVWSERVRVGSTVGGFGNGARREGFGRVLVVVVVSIIGEVWISEAS